MKIESLNLAQVERLIEKGKRYKATHTIPSKKLREKKGRVKAYGKYW